MDKHELPTVALKAPIHISSPGAEMSASVGCYHIDLAIGRHVLPTDLIILKSQGLDVILGMDWYPSIRVLSIVPVVLSLSVHQLG